MIVSFSDYTPPARYDSVPWTQIRVEEAAASTGTWATIDTIDIPSPDGDPADPQTRSFTTDQGTAPDLWYRLTYLDAAANESAPTSPVQNTGPVEAYATADDLFRVLKVRTPSADQTAAAQGDLDTATIEINHEIDLATPGLLTSEQLDLCKGVCIDRAADLWRHRESAAGILGITDETIPTAPGRYSWARYAARLSVLKDNWGIA